MRTFSLTKKAKADLKSIAAFTQRKWGKEQRGVYVKQFDETFRLLAKNPNLGAQCEYIKRGYRKFPCLSHIIFYRNKSDVQIEIVRILHKRMDNKSHLGNT